MAGLQRAQVRIDQLRDELRRSAGAFANRQKFCGRDERENDGGCGGKPCGVWHATQLLTGLPIAMKIGVNAFLETRGRDLAKTGALDAAADFIPACDGFSAVRTDGEMLFEFGCADGVEFAIEIGMRHGMGLFTRHGRSPSLRRW